MAQVTVPQTTRWQEITQIWSDNRWLYVIAGVLLGILITPALEQITGSLNALIGNLVPEAVGIIFTVLILDRLAENRATEQLQTRLIREASGQSNEMAKAAVDWMRAEGWLTTDDKTPLLQGANLYQANLQGAYLRDADLSHANLNWAKLQGAKLYQANLHGVQLAYAKLQGADLYRANLEAVVWHTEMSHQIIAAVLPDGTDWTPHTDMERFTNPHHPDYMATYEQINRIREALGYERIQL